MAEGNGTTWALILGVSSGFGAACARELARSGVDIFGVHLDRSSTLPAAKQVQADIEALGHRAIFFNQNAANADKRGKVIQDMKSAMGTDGAVGVLVHSLAFGSLVPYFSTESEEEVTQPQMEMTLDVMAHSLVYWTQDLVREGLMRSGGRIFALTSSGSSRVWSNYGEVSAAKAALESHIRQIAYELAPRGIRANAIRAGVTDTPALRKIPGAQRLYDIATGRNPSGRPTTTEDVARAISLLCDPRADWITGNVINVDGGEEITV
ncbi:MAG: SDR family oxidoreductase [Dehalococcoidia bacterium]|nr:SDR family oxidoreductase [Dehalococcoidia bacterium]